MRTMKWVVVVLALGMMAATAGWLNFLKGRHLLGQAGVRVEQVPIYDGKTNLISRQSVVLPANVPGVFSVQGLVDPSEVAALPQDTTYGLRYYSVPGTDSGVQLSVILMGTDHTSIHQPQYCLYAQNWNITREERVKLRMNRPYPYDVPAIRLTGSQIIPKTGRAISCLYVYWFVSGEKITAEEGSRLWSMWKTMLQKGKMERWAYISYFVTCVPGEEQVTYERLEKFIQTTAPEFQLVTGPRSGSEQSGADRGKFFDGARSGMDKP